MKSFGQKSWMLPQPVLIIGTYDKEGKPNAMNAAWGGQWDAKEIMISMGAHATTENLSNCQDFTVAFATKQTMVAAEAVENPLVRRYGKRGGFLPVEGTKAKQVGAGTPQCHVLSHHIFNWIPGNQLVNKGSRKGHGCPSFLWLKWSLTVRKAPLLGELSQREL